MTDTPIDTDPSTPAADAEAQGGPGRRSVLDGYERNPIKFGATLDALACDVADLLDRGNYGIRVSQDDIPTRPALVSRRNHGERGYRWNGLIKDA